MLRGSRRPPDRDLRSPTRGLDDSWLEARLQLHQHENRSRCVYFAAVAGARQIAEKIVARGSVGVGKFAVQVSGEVGGGISVDGVAERAGCSRATLYRYVGGKAAMRDGVMARSAAAVATEVSAAVASLTGTPRVVEAILVSVRAIRADAAVGDGLIAVRATGTDNDVTSSKPLGDTAIELAGFDAGEEHRNGWSG